MDQELEAPIDDLEAFGEDDVEQMLGDGVKTVSCSPTLSPS